MDKCATHVSDKRIGTFFEPAKYKSENYVNEQKDSECHSNIVNMPKECDIFVIVLILSRCIIV